MKIGCYPEEQMRTAPVTLTLELQLPGACGTEDDLTSSVDYDALAAYLEQTVLQRRFQLLEYACREIYGAAKSFLQTHRKRAKVRVTLTKMLTHALLRDSRFRYGDF